MVFDEATARRSAMRIDGRDSRTLWLNPDGRAVDVIDQRALPHRIAVRTLRGFTDAAEAIADMTVRGAPLIGATAAYGMALAPSTCAGRSIGRGTD
jgi:methylthioribose-1-phosphate isomerase